jgi:hypothetical protein
MDRKPKLARAINAAKWDIFDQIVLSYRMAEMPTKTMLATTVLMAAQMARIKILRLFHRPFQERSATKHRVPTNRTLRRSGLILGNGAANANDGTRETPHI